MKPTDQQILDIAMALHDLTELRRRIPAPGKHPLFTSGTELTEIIIDQWEAIRPPDPLIQTQAEEIARRKEEIQRVRTLPPKDLRALAAEIVRPFLERYAEYGAAERIAAAEKRESEALNQTQTP